MDPEPTKNGVDVGARLGGKGPVLANSGPVGGHFAQGSVGGNFAQRSVGGHLTQESGGAVAKPAAAVMGVNHMTSDQLVAETNQMQLDMLKSTQRALQELDGAEKNGAATLESFARQDEQLDNIVVNLDKMRTDIKYSDVMMQKIASPFAFLHLKKEIKEFETVFGTSPHWSGPMLKKGGLIRRYSMRYFALVYSRLIYFLSEKNVFKGDLHFPRGEMCIKGAKIDSNRDKLEITLRSGSERWLLRCVSKLDFAGWLTMLERHAAGDFVTSVQGEGQDSAAVAAADPPDPGVVVMQKHFYVGQNTEMKVKTIDDQVDDNIDLMMQKIDLLGRMACEQKQAVDFQNSKLDVIKDTMDNTDRDMLELKRKHKTRLKGN